MRNSGRGYDIALLTTAESGRRNRRTIDAPLLGFAALWTAAAAVIAKSAPTEDQDVADAIVTVRIRLQGGSSPLTPVTSRR